MKGRQKSLTAFLKATNLSSCLLADLLSLLVMILYSSSFSFSFILFVVLFPFIPFEKGRYFVAYQSLKIPLPPSSARWVPNYGHRVVVPTEPVPLVPESLDSLCYCALPLPWRLCARDQFAFSKICSLGPQGIASLHPFLDFPCHSCCPKHISTAHLFHCPMRSFLNSHLHCSEAIRYTVCREQCSFLCYFWFKERRGKWLLQRGGEQTKEWMNRFMNKAFAKEQKYACYLASWSAIIFIPCRGYSVSLFLGLAPNLTDVALALQAEPRSANLLHLPCSTRIARERIVPLLISFFCGSEGKERVLQQTTCMACVSVESYVLISFQSVGGLLLTLIETELKQRGTF